MEEIFSKFGPEWLLIGVLVTSNLKLIFSIMKIVENNTTALTKLTEKISHCTKNAGD